MGRSIYNRFMVDVISLHVNDANGINGNKNIDSMCAFSSFGIHIDESC